MLMLAQCMKVIFGNIHGSSIDELQLSLHPDLEVLFHLTVTKILNKFKQTFFMLEHCALDGPTMQQMSNMPKQSWQSSTLVHVDHYAMSLTIPE